MRLWLSHSSTECVLAGSYMQLGASRQLNVRATAMLATARVFFSNQGNVSWNRSYFICLESL